MLNPTPPVGEDWSKTCAYVDMPEKTMASKIITFFIKPPSRPQ